MQQRLFYTMMIISSVCFLHTLWSVVSFNDCDSSMNDVVSMNNLYLSSSSADEYTVRNVKANLQSAFSTTQWSISSKAYVNDATW